MILLLALAHATPGELTMPLDAWNGLQPHTASVSPPNEPLPVSRTLTGTVERGLLDARLSTKVVAMAPLVLPLLPASTTVSSASLDGRPAAMFLDDHYRVDLGVGPHIIEVSLLHGQATDRFERRVRLPLPNGGPTQFNLVLPEAPIDVTLAQGVITQTRREGGTTRVIGWLDGRADLDLAWERRATHNATDARLDAEVYALVELGGDLVTGVAATTFQVLSGEVDRVALSLPDGLEITEVTGPDVLQWHTREGRLEVLLRSVVDESVALNVRFQYPGAASGPTPLILPLPDGPIRGALGVVAPVALDVELATVQGATPIPSRDMPQSLVQLSPEPLRLAMSFNELPTASASTTRQADVLTSASRIDDLQGISIAMEDGTELGKLRLSVLNADRQVLTVDLPPGARLTHCFRDGLALRPAADTDHPNRVLIPLTRSLKNETRTYTVRPGDSLTLIANDNYGDANQWQTLQWANPQLASDQLNVGDVIVLPTLSDGDTESFTLELGWERTATGMAPFGQRTVELPTLDLDVQSATWHLYFPEHLEALSVQSNLMQVSGLRTDPLTRVMDFLVHSGATGQAAYAGGDYENALVNRRSYSAAKQQAAVVEPLSAYPLVGQRIRFRGTLLGTDAPKATVRYISENMASTIRFALFLAAAGVGWRVGREPRGATSMAAGAGLAVAVGLFGHYLLGTYSKVAWGTDLGLLVALASLVWTHRKRPGWLEAGAAAGAFFLTPVLLLAKPTLIPVLLAPTLYVFCRRAQ